MMVTCKLHNFIIDSGSLSYFMNLELATENNINGDLLVHLQIALHIEQDNQRNRLHARENTRNGDEIVQRFNALGFVHTRPRI